ncbi:hypothetical protein FGB62_387g05 [Gracilaria domingensis]|nr:hypothetical protein FGB62_409g02 [Gracilaria domingensis]KAI0556847.1 hypothetical protein FGB62_387g05 [Gracilaria domingensis]
MSPRTGHKTSDKSPSARTTSRVEQNYSDEDESVIQDAESGLPVSDQDSQVAKLSSTVIRKARSQSKKLKVHNQTAKRACNRSIGKNRIGKGNQLLKRFRGNADQCHQLSIAKKHTKNGGRAKKPHKFVSKTVRVVSESSSDEA